MPFLWSHRPLFAIFCLFFFFFSLFNLFTLCKHTTGGTAMTLYHSCFSCVHGYRYLAGGAVARARESLTIDH